jgi:hypothetical protein
MHGTTWMSDTRRLALILPWSAERVGTGGFCRRGVGPYFIGVFGIVRVFLPRTTLVADTTGMAALLLYRGAERLFNRNYFRDHRQRRGRRPWGRD